MSVEPWINVELKHGTSHFHNPWGRRVIQAIDLDNCLTLFEVFDSRNTSVDSIHEADINAQANLFGYGNYLWTRNVHKYIGDTALHIALRQKKMMCLHMLLILKADFRIKNSEGLTANDLAKDLLKTTIPNLAFESMKYLLNNLSPGEFKRLPDNAVYRSLQKEAWELMQEGRILYCELPASLNTSGLELISATEKKSYMSFNQPGYGGQDAADGDLATVLSIDSQQTLVRGDVIAGESSQVSCPPPAAPSASDWTKLQDDDGNEYYYNEVTGESSWDRPLEQDDNYDESVTSAATESKEQTTANTAPAVQPGEESMGLASQEYHSFLTRQQGGNESNQDDHAEIAALRERIRHMEKVDAQRAKQRAQQHTAATRDAAELSRRMAADAARQEELAQLKATVAARIQENKERLRRRLEEDQLGKSNSPGALATGDVWSRGTVSDVVSLINRQNKRRQQLATESDQFVAKGLPLLGSVKMRSAAERVSVQDSQLQAADSAQLAIPDNITPEMQLLPGVQKLKFLKIGQLSALAQSISNTQTIPLSTQDRLNVSSPAKRIMSNIPDKLLHPPSPGRSFSHSPTGKSFLYDSAPHPRTVEYPTSREITVVSTASNLKYMRVGDAGLADLSRALHRDAVITQLNLSSARVSCVGAVSLASVLPTMAALRHLDLSCNLLGDAGAQALASALTVAGCRLEKLVLAGNRVQLRGAIALVQAVFDSSVSWMSLSNNRLTSSDRQQMVKLFEERDYAPENPSRVESQPAAFVRNPPICVTRVRKMTRLSRSERDEMEGGKSQDEEDSKYEDEDDDSRSSGRFDRNNFLDEDQPKKFII